MSAIPISHHSFPISLWSKSQSPYETLHGLVWSVLEKSVSQKLWERSKNKCKYHSLPLSLHSLCSSHTGQYWTLYCHSGLCSDATSLERPSGTTVSKVAPPAQATYLASFSSVALGHHLTYYILMGRGIFLSKQREGLVLFWG